MISSHESQNTNLAGPDQSFCKDSHVAGQIVSLISTRNMESGQRLPGERQMAEQFGCSRNTVREALAGLEVAGIVEIRRRSGCYATGRTAPIDAQPVPDKDTAMQQAMDALLLVGPKLAQVAAPGCTLDCIRQLEAVTARLGRALVDRDPISAHRFLMEFYGELARTRDNHYLWNFFREIGTASTHAPQKTLWAGIEVEKQVENFFARHIEMLQALREQSPHEASILSERAVLAYMALAVTISSNRSAI